jgi:ribonuclease G
MTKDMVIAANRHETKVAILEDDQLVEIYFQRANEYSLVGSIHKGRVTRVLPGMQSAFVDLGLERDAFLYVSDFFEQTGGEDYERVPVQSEERGRRAEVREKENGGGVPASDGDQGDRRNRRGRRRRGRGRGLPESKYSSGSAETAEPPPAFEAAVESTEAVATEEEPIVLPGESLAKYRRRPVAPVAGETVDEVDEAAETDAEFGGPSGDSDDGIDAAELMADRLMDERRAAEILDEDEEEDDEGEESLAEQILEQVEEQLEEEVELTDEDGEPEARPDPSNFEDSAGEPGDVPGIVRPRVTSAPDEPDSAGPAESAAGANAVDEPKTAAAQTAEGAASVREDYLPRYIQPRSGRVRRRRGRGGDRPERGGDRPERSSDRPERSEPVERSAPPERGERREARHERRQSPEDRPPAAAAEPAERSDHAEKAELPSIADLLKEGQEIIVQIAKEPLGQKGARITSHIAIPGRYVVYMPTIDHLGVSRKVSTDDERQRLKRVVQTHSAGMQGGFIVRTAGDGRSEEEIAADMTFLYNLWLDMRQKAERRKAPCLLHHDLELVRRTLRDQLSDSFKSIWVDDEETYESILHFLERFQPAMVNRVKLYTRPTPIFEAFNVTAELEKALRPKVWLKSGGYIVINQTEALVAIDINTGKFVGKSNRLEDTIVKTNTEAVREIVRQVRLRDLGGIIVVDFIDMDERRNRQKVMQALEEAMRADRAPYKILQFNDFGLVAITRRRVKQSLERALCTPCGVCEGAGYVKSPQTVIGEILTEARKMAQVIEGKDVVLRIHPDVGKVLKSSPERYLEELEEVMGRPVMVKGDPLLHPEKFDLG